MAKELFDNSMIKKMIFLLISCFIGSSVWGEDFSKDQISVDQLKKEQQTQRLLLRELEGKIRKTQEDILAIKNQQDKLSVLISQNELEQKKHREKGQRLKTQQWNRVMDVYMLLMADQENPGSMVEQDLILEGLKKQKSDKGQSLRKQSNLFEKGQSLSEQLKKLGVLEESQLNYLKKMQKQKLQLIANINGNKLKLREINFRALGKMRENKGFSEMSPDPLKSDKINPRDRDHSFSLPVTNYIKYARDKQGDEQGIEFECLDKCSLRAIGTGQVVYQGDLAPYGRVLMIEHSAGIRSIYLGKLQQLPRTGQKVYKGEELGFVAESPIAKIYFEIRSQQQVLEVMNYLPL